MANLVRGFLSRPPSSISLLHAKQPPTFHGRSLYGQSSAQRSSSTFKWPSPTQAGRPRQKTSSTPSPLPSSPTPTPPPHTTIAADRTTTPRPPSSSPEADLDQILAQLNIARNQPSSSASRTAADVASISRAVGQSAMTFNFSAPQARTVDLKLSPTIGRQVYVEPERGLDLPGALRVLQSVVTANKIRRQANAQKFHVRRGQMKKNRRMARWRALFKASFVQTVKKIQRMRAQGW